MSTYQISVSTINKEVYEQLRFKISVGEIPPGTKITIKELAEKFGVSTMPVREALRRLQAEGYLEFENRSYQVLKLSLNDLEQLFIIRQRLETLAVEWAIPYITPDDMKYLKKLLVKMDDKNISFHDWQKINREFHLYLYGLSNSAQLQQRIINVWDAVTPYLYIYSTSVASFDYSQAQHYLMLELLKDKKTDALCNLLIEHLVDTYNTIIEQFKKDRAIYSN